MLPQDVKSKIDAYWNKLIKNGKKYKRGEVFTVTKKEYSDEKVEVLVEKTDYAHYLYCQNVDTCGKYGVHIIHTSVIVETLDGKIVFGKMSSNTSRAGIHQLCGGGIDNKDLRGDIFDLDHNIKNELNEELGIDLEDKKRITAFGLAYLKTGGPTDKIAVVYKIVLNETGKEFMKKYNDFVLQLQKKDEQAEFSDIIILDKKKEAFEKFFSKKDIKVDECMKPLFEYIGKHDL